MSDEEKALVWDEAVNYGIDHHIIGGTDGDELLAANPYRPQNGEK